MEKEYRPPAPVLYMIIDGDGDYLAYEMRYGKTWVGVWTPDVDEALIYVDAAKAHTTALYHRASVVRYEER